MSQVKAGDAARLAALRPPRAVGRGTTGGVKSASEDVLRANPSSKFGTGVFTPGINPRLALAFRQWRLQMRCFVPWKLHTLRQKAIGRLRGRVMRRCGLRALMVWKALAVERRSKRVSALRIWRSVSHQVRVAPFKAWAAFALRRRVARARESGRLSMAISFIRRQTKRRVFLAWAA